MSLQDRETGEVRPCPTASLAFCGSGSSPTPDQNGPDPHFRLHYAADVLDCCRLLTAGPSTLWGHSGASYYVLTDDLTGGAYLVMGSRAGELEAELGRLGHKPDRIATARTAQESDAAALHACRRRFFWMGPVGAQVMRSITVGRG